VSEHVHVCPPRSAQDLKAVLSTLCVVSQCREQSEFERASLLRADMVRLRNGVIVDANAALNNRRAQKNYSSTYSISWKVRPQSAVVMIVLSALSCCIDCCNTSRTSQ
jgi:hypothetical protein